MPDPCVLDAEATADLSALDMRCGGEVGSTLLLHVPDTGDARPSPAPEAQDRPSQVSMPDASSSSEALPPAPDAPSPSAEEGLLSSTEVPNGIDADGLAKIAGAAGGDSTLTIALALIAVVGAGTTWKFFTQLSEQKHEQRMKQLEIEARAQGNGAAQPPPCQAATMKLEAEIAELKTRLVAVEKKATTLSADFDGEDVERQLKKLQKAVKAMQEAHDAR